MKYLYVLLLTLTVNACSGQRNQKTEESNVAPPTFEMVSVPTLITDPVERAEYLVKHYWDKFDFKDTTYIHEPQVTEQALSNYIDLMNYVSPAAMSSSVKAMMKQTEQDSAMFQYFSEMMEKYLYDPNSPLRNEEMYSSIGISYRILVIKRCGKDTSRPFARARIKKQNRDACDRFHVHISERKNREIIQYKSGLSIIIFL